MIFLLLILTVEVAPAFAFSRLLRRRTRWSNLRVASIAAFPIPVLSGALAAYLAGYERLIRNVDGQPADLAVTISFSVAVCYFIALAVALVTARSGKQPPLDADVIADVFK